MLLSPLLNKGLEALSGKQLVYITTVLVYINCISGWLFKNGINPNGFNVIQFVFIYVLGYGIRRFDVPGKIKMSHCIAAYIVLSILIGLILDNLPVRWGGYNNPLVVLKSVIVFCIFLKIRFHSRIVNRIGACVFPCYLLQCGVAGLLFFEIQYQVWQALRSPWEYFGFAILCAIAFFCLSLLLEPLRKAIMGRLENLLYNRLHLEKIDAILEQKR